VSEGLTERSQPVVKLVIDELKAGGGIRCSRRKSAKERHLPADELEGRLAVQETLAKQSIPATTEGESENLMAVIEENESLQDKFGGVEPGDWRSPASHGSRNERGRRSESKGV
jgi:hypothetical protein